MLVRLLQSRLIDILLIAAALYFLIPRFFPRRRKQEDAHKGDRTIIIHQQNAHPKEDDKKGEYIDYEEIK